MTPDPDKSECRTWYRSVAMHRQVAGVANVLEEKVERRSREIAPGCTLSLDHFCPPSSECIDTVQHTYRQVKWVCGTGSAMQQK